MLERLAVYDATLQGRKLTFRKSGAGFADNETGSTWNLLGTSRKR